MRVLLDENLPRGLKQDLEGHEVFTVPEMGWSGIADTDLLTRAGDRFEVLVTADRNLEFQQDVSAGSVGAVVLVVPNTRLQTVRSLVPAVPRRTGDSSCWNRRPTGRTTSVALEVPGRLAQLAE